MWKKTDKPPFFQRTLERVCEIQASRVGLRSRLRPASQRPNATRDAPREIFSSFFLWFLTRSRVSRVSRLRSLFRCGGLTTRPGFLMKRGLLELSTSRPDLASASLRSAWRAYSKTRGARELPLVERERERERLCAGHDGAERGSRGCAAARVGRLVGDRARALHDALRLSMTASFRRPSRTHSQRLCGNPPWTHETDGEKIASRAGRAYFSTGQHFQRDPRRRRRLLERSSGQDARETRALSRVHPRANGDTVLRGTGLDH